MLDGSAAPVYTLTMNATVQSRAQLREDQLIIAAEACFQRAGFHAATMSEIAQEAGMSVGQIYRHFANKEALIAKIVERETDRTLQLVEAAFAASEDKVATLVGQVPSAITRATDPTYAKLMLEVAAEAARNLVVASALQRADAAARARFRLMMEAINGPKCDSGEIDARIEVLSLLFEGLPWRLVRNPAMDLAQFTDHLRRLVTDLILITPVRPS